jgi:uncharacterized protein (UPF0218 family)
MINKWNVGDIVTLGGRKNLKVTAVYPIKDNKTVRYNYMLQKADDEKTKYKYSFTGGLVRIY